MKRKADELNKWRASTLDAARPHTVEKQRSLGKLTARARNDLLFDPGTFFEFGQLAEASNVPDKETPDQLRRQLVVVGEKGTGE